MEAAIKDLGERVSRIDPRNPAERTLYNFAFGALYALGRAVKLRYVEQTHRESASPANELRVSKQRAEEVQKLARILADQDELPTQGDWLAGYYYNDALLRVDVCYEQVVRYYLDARNNKKFSQLLPEALEQEFPVHLLVPIWLKVRRQVNDIKHNRLRKPEGPEIPPDQTCKAVETLISAVEWVLKNGPAKKNGLLPKGK